MLNVGGLEPIAHRDLAQLLVGIAGSGRYRFVEWPPEKKAIDIGDFYADSTRIGRTLGWNRTSPWPTGCAGRSTSTASTSIATCPRQPLPRRCDRLQRRSVPRSSPPRGRGRRAGSDRPRDGARMGTSSGRKWRRSNRSSRLRAAHRSPSAQAAERMRSRCCCARPVSARTTSDRAGRHGRLHRARRDCRRRSPDHRRRRRRDADHRPAACAAAVGSRTRAIVPVHLYGQPADMPALAAIAARHNLAIVEDCCQAHLATCGGTAVGTYGGRRSASPTKILARSATAERRSPTTPPWLSA